MEDLYLSFSESLPVATLLMFMALLLVREKSTAVRRHQLLFWSLLIAFPLSASCQNGRSSHAADPHPPSPTRPQPPAVTN